MSLREASSAVNRSLGLESWSEEGEQPVDGDAPRQSAPFHPSQCCRTRRAAPPDTQLLSNKLSLPTAGPAARGPQRAHERVAHLCNPTPIGSTTNWNASPRTAPVIDDRTVSYHARQSKGRTAVWGVAMVYSRLSEKFEPVLRGVRRAVAASGTEQSRSRARGTPDARKQKLPIPSRIERLQLALPKMQLLVIGCFVGSKS